MEKDEIGKVIVDAYIGGIHGNQDENAIARGFHPDFTMLVLGDNGMRKVSMDEWLKRIDEQKKKNPELWKGKTTYDFKLIDVTGSAACIKMDVFKNSKHFSCDYMLLYKFGDGWKIVSKIFSMPV